MPIKTTQIIKGTRILCFPLANVIGKTNDITMRPIAETKTVIKNTDKMFVGKVSSGAVGSQPGVARIKA